MSGNETDTSGSGSGKILDNRGTCGFFCHHPRRGLGRCSVHSRTPGRSWHAKPKPDILFTGSIVGSAFAERIHEVAVRDAEIGGQMTSPGSIDGVNVLIVEANMTGHRPYYVKLLVEAALAAGRTVAVASSHGATGFTSEDAVLHLAELSGQFGPVEIEEVTPDRVGELSRALGAEVTVIPDGDRFAMKLAVGQGWKGTGVLSILIMRETAQAGRLRVLQVAKTVVRTALFRRANSFANVRMAVLKSAWWTGEARFLVARDPITLHRSLEVEERLRNDWGIDADRYWFAVLGAISKRKNIDLVARALADLDTSRIGLLIAGAWDDSLGAETLSAISDLRNSGGQVVVINQRLKDHDLDGAVRVADCLVLAHSNEGPSGLLGKAAAAGTRVVAAGARSLRDDLRALPDQGVWVELNRRELSRTLSYVADQQQAPPRLWDQTHTAFTEALL